MKEHKEEERTHSSILAVLVLYHSQSITVSSKRASLEALFRTTMKRPSLKLARHEPAGLVLPVLTPSQPSPKSLLVLVQILVQYTVTISSL